MRVNLYLLPLFAICALAAEEPPADRGASDRKALSPFQDFVGKWKGAGVPKAGGGAWSEEVVPERAGPARYYTRADGKGTIGFVSPLSHNFCGNCNRLRLTARGELRTCLFADEDVPLAHHLAEPDWRDRVLGAIRRTLHDKPPSHYLAEGRWGNMVSFVNVGG